MTNNEAGQRVLSNIKVTREDVARAKAWLVKANDTSTQELADEWLTEQRLIVPKEVDLLHPNCEEELISIARAYSMRLAFYQAVAELVANTELIAAGSPTYWEGNLAGKYGGSKGAIPLKGLRCSFPQLIERMPFAT